MKIFNWLKAYSVYALALIWLVSGGWIGEVFRHIFHGRFKYYYEPVYFWIGLSINVILFLLLYRYLTTRYQGKELSLGLQDLRRTRFGFHTVSLPTNARVRLTVYCSCYILGIIAGYVFCNEL